LYALRINQRHNVANTTFEFNLNFPILSHHITSHQYKIIRTTHVPAFRPH